MINAKLMSEYNYETLPDGTCKILSPKDKYKTKYVIPEGVSSIAPRAFKTEDSILEEVVLPESLKKIGKEAFFECTQLTKINIPSGLNYIGEYAFSDCNLKILKLEIPKGVKKILEGTFSGSEINELLIPSTIRFETDYEEGAFSYAEIDKLVIEEGALNIGYDTFQHAKIKEVIIPGSISSIDGECFSDSKIDKLVINEGVKHIGDSAFEDAFLPKVVFLPTSLVSIGDELFESVENTEIIVYDGNAKFSSGNAKVLSLSEYNKLYGKDKVIEPEKKPSPDLSCLFNSEEKNGTVLSSKTNQTIAKSKAKNEEEKKKESLYKRIVYMVETEEKHKYKSGVTSADEFLKKWPDDNSHFDRDIRTTRRGVTFYYIVRASKYYLVGIGSDHLIKNLDLDIGSVVGFSGIIGDCLSNIGVESICLPRFIDDKFSPLNLECKNWKRAFNIETVIIPKEAKLFSIRKEHLGAVRKIIFESPEGWGVKKEIISDPEKMCEYLRSREETNLKKSILNSVKGIFGIVKK